MKKRGVVKSLLGVLLSASIILMNAMPQVEAANNPQKEINDYQWTLNDQYIEYSPSMTTANSTGGKNPQNMLDGKENTRWELPWSTELDSVDIVLSMENQEYVTGIKYVSRMDNNMDPRAPIFKIYASLDGSNYSETPVKEMELQKKPGTFYLLFDKPVKAKSIKINTTIMSASEMRILYQPSSADDYDKLIGIGEQIRSQAGAASGEDNGLWPPEALSAFDTAFNPIKEQGKPTEPEKLLETDIQLTNLIRDLKRAQLFSTVELQGQLRTAEELLASAFVGDSPLSWTQEDIDAFKKVMEKAAGVAENQVSPRGLVLDAQTELKDAVELFKAQQKRPEIQYTGTVLQPLEYIMDGLTSTHFQGSGTGENVYFELDYKNVQQFESVTISTWWATIQCINKVKVQVKDETGNWTWADEGKEYQLSYKTNTSESEAQTLTFDKPVKGSALRIYIMSAANKYVVDEIGIGLNVDEADVRIILDQYELNMYEGDTGKITATILPESVANKNVNWSSSNEKIVSVDKGGNLKVIALPVDEESAQVTITATTEYGNKTASCEITVLPKIATEDDKEKCRIRIRNANKLANAAKEEEYQPNAISEFKKELTDVEEDLKQESLRLGAVEELNNRVRNAEEQFSLKSFLPIENTKELIDRITGKGSSENFEIEIIPKDSETGMDVYEVDWNSSTNKPILRGNDGVSLATAYNYYLKYFAYLDFSYVDSGAELKLPDELPKVGEKVRVVFPYEYRHYFNENCEYKYTTLLYSEKEWQHRIDWLAMNGFNMFLLDMGNNYVWYNAREELGLDDAALKELYKANTSEGQYFGKYDISKEAMEREGKLARKVVEMAFDAGLEPEIRPFCGLVPFMFPSCHDDYYGVTGKTKMTIEQPGSFFDGMFLYAGSYWMNMPTGVYFSPEVAAEDSDKRDEMNKKFKKLAEIYYSSLQESLGFNEYGRTPKLGFKDVVGEQGFIVTHEAFPREVLKEIEDEFLKINPDAIWMMSSWRYVSWITEYFTKENVMFVDLSADNRPKWQANNEFGGTQWLWSMLFNFGGNTGMGGGLDHIAQDVIQSKQNSNYMSGVSISPEGGDTNPVLYGLMAEMTWRSTTPDVEQWLRDYTKRRYGVENYEAAKEEIDAAWKMLHQTVYSAFVSGDGPSQTLTNAYPKLSGAIARRYGSNAKVYKSEEIYPIWELMLEAAEKMPNMTEQFKYDLVDITRQALGDLSGDIYAQIKPKYEQKNREDVKKYTDLMVKVCQDMDKILKTRKEFMLGTRLEAAKNRGVTDADKLYYEKLERTFLTYWIVDKPDSGGLLDYCNRHLSGLMTDYYGMRWEIFGEHLLQAFDKGMTSAEFNSKEQPLIDNEIKEKMVKWVDDRTPYPTENQGNPVEISTEILKNYQPVIKELYGDNIFTADKTELIKAIEEAKTKSQEAYTEESWKIFHEALVKAEEVNNDAEAIQVEINNAEKELRMAMEALETKVDKTALNKAITEAETKQKSDYTEESWTPFAKALEEAKAVYENPKATQTMVDEATTDLLEKMDGLEVAENPGDNIPGSGENHGDGGNNGNHSSNKVKPVETGDSSALLLYVVLGIAALIVIEELMRRKFKK